jgi:hypothetical protein
VDPQRKAPRWNRRLVFSAEPGFRGDVLDLSAVGLRVRVRGGTVQAGPALLPGQLAFEDGSRVALKVRVARAEVIGEYEELGLEIAEADKSFFDALPELT